jgi:hypothetical protein
MAFKRLVAVFSPQMPGLNSRPVHMGKNVTDADFSVTTSVSAISIIPATLHARILFF